MANRLGTPTAFAPQAPPWSLVQLDANATAVNTFANDSSQGFVNGVPADSGTVNNYSVTLPVGTPSSYNPGMVVSFLPANTNNGASTLTVSPLGSASILTPAGNALQGGEIAKSAMCTVQYNNASPVGFRIMGACPLAFTASYSVPTNPTIECAGYTSVAVYITLSGSATTAINLAHLGDGVPVLVDVQNTRGVASSYSINSTTPAGVSRTQTYATFSTSAAGSAPTIISSGTSITANTSVIYVGQAVNNNLYFT